MHFKCDSFSVVCLPDYRFLFCVCVFTKIESCGSQILFIDQIDQNHLGSLLTICMPGTYSLHVKIH